MTRTSSVVLAALLLIPSPSHSTDATPFLVIMGDGEEATVCNPVYDPTGKTFVFENCPFIFKDGFE